MIDFDKLSAEFPKEQISWRAQTLTQKKDKALALAYIDARDVMNRLDDVCGPDGWQSIHYDLGQGKTGCKIGIKCGDEWIWKSDGAGDTAVEKDKGGISDATKRAAVSWGIGRYLYTDRFKNIWVKCSTWDKNGKAMFDKFIGDPWALVKKEGAPSGVVKPKWTGPLIKTKLMAEIKAYVAKMDICETEEDFNSLSDVYAPVMAQAKIDLLDWHNRAFERAEEIYTTIQQAKEMDNGPG